MTLEENASRWGLPEIIDIINIVDDILYRQTVVTETAHDYPNLVIQTTAKAILNMREIMALLYNGYPDGALSLGRTIYEQAVILTFINKHLDTHGEELLRRYYDDHDVKRLDNLIEIQEFFLHAEDEQKAKIAQNGLVQLRQEYELLKREYGVKKFQQYWWAHIDDEHKIGLEGLSRCADFGTLKILYKRACIAIHSSAMGDFALLGRDNPDGSQVYTGLTLDGYEAPLALAFGAFKVILDAAFKLISFDDENILKRILDKSTSLRLALDKKL